MDNQEARRFMDEEFWPWFRRKTYPSCSTIFDVPTTHCEETTEQHWRKHLKLAGQYIQGYRKWGKVTADSLTDMVPKEMRDKVKIALEMLKK